MNNVPQHSSLDTARRCAPHAPRWALDSAGAFKGSVCRGCYLKELIYMIRGTARPLKAGWTTGLDESEAVTCIKYSKSQQFAAMPYRKSQ
jgi:hypothetical protein